MKINKKLTIILLCIVTMLWVITDKSYAIPNVSIEIVNPSTIIEGNIFEARVLASGIDASDPLISFGFDIHPDPEFTLDSLTIGSDFDDVSGLFLSTDAAGMVSNLGTVSGDNILLASLFFIPSMDGIFNLGVGTDPINFGLFEGLFVTSFNVYDISAQSSVNVAPIPEPGTLILVGSGLTGLVGILRRRRMAYNKIF